jgi:hypothetical protein
MLTPGAFSSAVSSATGGPGRPALVTPKGVFVIVAYAKHPLKMRCGIGMFSPGGGVS